MIVRKILFGLWIARAFVAAGAQAGVPAVATVVSRPLPTFASVSSDFLVTANGTAVAVEHYRDRHVASFSTSGLVTLKIRIRAPITDYSIHPSSFGLKGIVNGDTLTVSVSPTLFDPQPSYLLFRINHLENLVVFVEPIEKNAPIPGAPGIFDVSAVPYSADSSGRLLATLPIQSAIDEASRKGGGVVYVRPGIYRVQSLTLKSGVTLYLADGAVIQGSDLVSDFLTDPTYLKKRDLPYIIQAENFRNIAIRGRGWIDAAEDTVRTPEGASAQVEPKGIYRRGIIRVTRGTGFTLEGITVRDSTTWSMVTDQVDGTNISRLKLLGPLWPTTDGIDIAGSNADVDKSFVYTGDDNFCAKALAKNYPLRNIRFRNSIGYGNSAGVKAGMQLKSSQSNIHFENIDILHTGRGLVVEHRDHDRGGQVMENISFTNIRVELVEGHGGMSRNPIHIQSEGPGTIRNITFKHIRIGNFGPKPSEIKGNDRANPVNDVVFEDVTIGGKAIRDLSSGDFKVKNAAGIRFLP